MSGHQIIIWLVIGGVAGWLAGLIVSGTGYGLLADILIGIVGAFIGGWLTTVFGVHVGSGFAPSLVVAVLGAVVLLIILRLARSMTGK